MNLKNILSVSNTNFLQAKKEVQTCTKKGKCTERTKTFKQSNSTGLN